MDPAPSFAGAYDALFFGHDSTLAVNHRGDSLTVTVAKGILAILAAVFLTIGLCCDGIIFTSAEICYSSGENLHWILSLPIKLAISVVCIVPALLYGAILIPYYGLEFLGKEI